MAGLAGLDRTSASAMRQESGGIVHLEPGPNHREGIIGPKQSLSIGRQDVAAALDHHYHDPTR